MSHRILVVSHDAALRQSRSALLISFGYTVESVETARNAMDAVSASVFDLVVVGRNSLSDAVPIDEQLRAKYPLLLILKIVNPVDWFGSFASRMTNAEPENVMLAVRSMLGQPLGDAAF